MPVPFFIWGLARGHLSIRGRRATLSPLSIFFQRGRGRRSFFALRLIFWGTSQRRRTWSLKDPQFLHGGVRYHFLLDFHPAFQEALVGVEHTSQHLSCLNYWIFNKAYPVGQRWGPWLTSPFYHFAPSGAEGRPSIPQLQKKHPNPLPLHF